MTKQELLISMETIREKIYIIRGQKVMLDRDLADLYGVLTKRLNEQVKRNIERFPDDFMFQLSVQEYQVLRSQFATLKRGKHRKYLPLVFTEHGIAMLSSILNSKVAIKVNIQIIRTFIKMRELMNIHQDLNQRINRVEANQFGQANEIRQINKIIEEMLSLPLTLKRKSKKIGF